ncbi:transposase [Methylobacterium sp. J-048]|uniref:transposase n=1 Tax=Methylobacterium sp. J-048 TaxID=2836635 RepID=UPI001FBB973F|nr:transposase [Methylobacterium sp. J-048]MCJ2057071.1 transposase [Methylobacterium sp. J-048]
MTEEYENHSIIEKKQVVIRQYGLLDPLDWDSDCDDEIDRSTKLWNSLVDIHEEFTQKYYDLILKDERLKTAKANYEKLQEERASVVAVSAAKKQLAVTQKEVSKRMASELRDLELARREAVKVARQNSGLWWGNYNPLVRAFENARSAAVRGGHTMRRRAPGGNSRITNTLQGGADVEHLFDGSLSQVMIRPPSGRAWSAESRGERRRLQRTRLTATVFVQSGERRIVTWPMVMHRPIPDDCRVKEVIITRRRVGERWKWATSFICTRTAEPAAPVPVGAKAIAVDIGWRRVPEGLRVATVASADGLPRFIVLQRDLIDSFAFADELRERVRTSARVGLELLQATDATLFDQPYQDLLIALQQRQEGRFAALKEFSRGSFFTAQSRDVLGAEITAWRMGYTKLATWLSNHQRKVVARRIHQYQNAAIEILEGASTIIINDVKFGEIARRSPPSDDGGFFPKRVNYYRVVAAPSEFVRCLKLQAAKRGIPFAKTEAQSPVGCPECGSTSRRSRADAMPQICEACGTSFDQDVATCRSLLMQDGRQSLSKMR